jgi:hypothetical protein
MSFTESWNRLPDKVKTTASKDSFERMLKQTENWLENTVG